MADKKRKKERTRVCKTNKKGERSCQYKMVNRTPKQLTAYDKMKKTNQDIFYWITWLMLVILWNFGYPSAIPIYDVLVAVILSIVFILIKKIK